MNEDVKFRIDDPPRFMNLGIDETVSLSPDESCFVNSLVLQA
jgi:hypothetical protein